MLGSSSRDVLVDFDRAYRIFHDIVASFSALQDLGPAVTVYGSARLGDGHAHYALARAMGGPLARTHAQGSSRTLRVSELPERDIETSF